jgi:CRP/FNR family transcriptional regulator
MKLSEALRGIFLFENLDEVHRRMVAECVTLCALEKGQHLYLEGDEALAFYAVLQGQCKVYRVTGGGDEFIIHIQRSGDVIAEAAMFDIKRYPASCVAMEDCSVLRIDSRGFTGLLLSEPTLSLHILHAYSRRLRGFVTALEDLSLRDVKSRLANYLLRNADEEEGQFVCSIPFSKKELATLLGTIPETLSRTLRDFKTRGLIEEQNGSFTLLQPSALRAYSSE